jgi:hypothetical protein
VWHCQGVDNALSEFLDDTVQSSDVVKCYWDLVRAHDFHGDCLLVLRQHEVLWFDPLIGPGRSFFVVPIIVILLLPFTAVEDVLQTSAGCERLLLCFCFCAGVGIEAGEY